MAKKNTIPAVEKSVRVLECLAASETGLSQSVLSRQLAIPAATCYRIIQTLLACGWIRKRGADYELSQGLLPLARKVCEAQSWQERIKAPLRELAQTTGLSAKLSVRQGQDEYATILREDSPRPMAVTGRVGATFPAIEGSVGGALLCMADEAELKALTKAAPDDLLEKQEPELLAERIRECRQHGYCSSNGRSRWGIEVISAPIVCDNEVVAAISVVGLKEHFDDCSGKAEAILQTKKACEKILAFDRTA